jgi:hypothetical protein
MNLTEFVGLSAVLTGIKEDDLLPNPDTQEMAQEYLDVLNRTDLVPPDTLNLLTQLWNLVASGASPDPIEKQVGQQIMQNQNKKVGRLAQNIIYMWYLATWYDLNTSPTSFDGNTFVISSKAYKNGKVWGLIGAHPMGYSEENFGYWNLAPTNS